MTRYRNSPTGDKYTVALSPNPVFRVGDMLAEYDKHEEKSMFLFTANSRIKSDGSLTMGAGIAKQVAERLPHLPAAAGKIVRDRCNNLGTYGVIIHPELDIGLFQTKTDWRLPSTLELIEYSLSVLSVYAYKTRTRTFHLNFPGIGYGELSREDVLPLLMEHLPSNVNVWEYKDKEGEDSK